MSNSQWNEDQAVGEKAVRELEARAELDQQLGGALRSSGITVEDVRSIELKHAIINSRQAHRVITACRCIEWWLSNGGGK